MGKSLYQKVWDAHTVGTLADGRTQLFIGTHLIHEVTSPQAFGMLRDLGLKVKYPQRTFATVDHIVPTDQLVEPYRDPLAQAIGRWGNWFNQELFGRPTDLPWGLEISDENLPPGAAPGTTLDYFLSFRSPYTYLALPRVRALAAMPSTRPIVGE